MSDVVSVIRASLQDAWADLWTVLVCNLLWLLSVLLIIPGPPATLALFYYTHRLAHGEVADVVDFWFGVRRYWGAAWRWGFINLLLIAFLMGDVILTGRLSQSVVAHLIQGFYLAVLGAWLILQLYALPFLFEQEIPSVRQALRNGAVMLGRNIGFSLTLVLLLALVLLLGTLLFMLSFAFGGFILAAAGNHAVLNRLDLQRIETKDLK
jgi:hypothetical protein